MELIYNGMEVELLHVMGESMSDVSFRERLDNYG